jgi:hypothetical protein
VMIVGTMITMIPDGGDDSGDDDDDYDDTG